MTVEKCQNSDAYLATYNLLRTKRGFVVPMGTDLWDLELLSFPFPCGSMSVRGGKKRANSLS